MPAWATPQPVDAPDIDVALATVIADLSASLTELGQKVEPSDLSALATGAKQDTGNTSLASILAKITSDPATQTTLAAVLAKLSADPATQTTLAAALVQLQGIAASVDGLEGFTDGLETALSTLNAKDFSTQTTAAAILAKLSSDPATQTTLAAVLAKLTSDPSTATLQTAANTKLDTLHTDIATTLLAKNEAMRALLAGTLLVGSGLVIGDSARKTSTSVGTAVALASNTAAKFVRVTALLTNTQQVNVGGASALAVAGSTAGDPLLPGDSTTFVVTNLNQIFLDVRVSGEGVSYTYWT